MSDADGGRTIVMKPPNAGYAWYVVSVLIAVNIMSTVDRNLLALVVAPVRHDLAISDTQISLLQGLAFAFFYSVMGLPLGWLADRSNRRNLIIAGLTFWSVSTIACGLADSFALLFTARIGVGIGEATLLPAAYSMIADYFPLHRRGRALGLFTIAQFAGVGVSWGVGSGIIRLLQANGAVALPVVGVLAPWKLAFMCVGAFGLLLSPLLVTLREPVRTGPRLGGDSVGGERNTSFFGYIFQNRSAFIPVYLVYGLLSFVGYNFQPWLPTYFDRRYHIPAAVIGAKLGLVITIAGTLGCIVSAILGDRWTASHKVGGKFRLTALWWTIAFLSVIALFFASNSNTALVLVLLFNFGAAIALSSAAASIQDIVPSDLRGRATAMYLLLIGIFGFGMGPTAVSLVTDYVFHDDSALMYSLIVVPIPAILIGGLLTWIGMKPYARVYQTLQRSYAKVR